MLFTLDNYQEVKSNVPAEFWKGYTNYELGLCIADKFTRCWTVMNVGLHYFRSIGIYQNYFQQIHGFEPDESFIGIQKEVNNNNWQNVHLYNIPMSSKQSNRTFYHLSKKDRTRTTIDPTKYLGNGSLNFNWAKKRGDGTITFDEKPVYTQTLDNIIKLKKIKNIDLIKIDAELEDTRIVFGSTRAIDRWRPVIQIEYVESKLHDWLLGKDYEIVEFEDWVYDENTEIDRYYIPKERL